MNIAPWLCGWWFTFYLFLSAGFWDYHLVLTIYVFIVNFVQMSFLLWLLIFSRAYLFYLSLFSNGFCFSFSFLLVAFWLYQFLYIIFWWFWFSTFLSVWHNSLILWYIPVFYFGCIGGSLVFWLPKVVHIYIFPLWNLYIVASLSILYGLALCRNF